MNYQDLFENYLMNKNENKEQIQTPISSSIQSLEPVKMLGKSGISEEEFDIMFAEIIKETWLVPVFVTKYGCSLFNGYEVVRCVTKP